MLERVKLFNTKWVKKGHRKGANTNDVSATVLKDYDGSMYKWGTLARAFEINNFPLEVIGNIHENQELLNA